MNRVYSAVPNPCHFIAVAQHRHSAAVHHFHKCHDGKREVHLREGNWRYKFSSHCGYGQPLDAFETPHHSRQRPDEPSLTSDCPESNSGWLYWGQSPNIQPGDEVQDEIIPDFPTCDLLEVDQQFQAWSSDSYNSVPLGHECEHNFPPYIAQ